MLNVAILLGLFLCAFFTALLAVSLVWGAAQVRAARQGGADADAEQEDNAALLKEENISTIAFWGSLLVRFSQVQALRQHISDANLNWTIGRVAAGMLLTGALAFVAANALSWLEGLPALAIGVLAASAPYVYIRAKRARRFAAFAAQFPDALDSLARALKAGYPLSAAVEMLAREYPQPLAGEMRRVREEYNLGVSWDASLDNLAARIPIPEVRLFTSAVKMQNRMGGRLNDVLGRLSESMRDSASLEGEIRSISAHSRITGMVLTVMPLGIGLVMLLVNPDYILNFLRQPTGQMLLSAALVSNIAAHLLIRKIVRIRM
jgi:tight adherence protein B